MYLKVVILILLQVYTKRTLNLRIDIRRATLDMLKVYDENGEYTNYFTHYVAM